jgi:mono/diheme cytochrome c family protein
MYRLCLLFVTLAVVPSAAFAQASAIERGQKVYAAEKCSVCHSIAGQGNKRGALDGVGSTRSGDEIREWIVNATDAAAKAKATRKPVMKSYGHMAKDDVDALVAYLRSLVK